MLLLLLLVLLLLLLLLILSVYLLLFDLIKLEFIFNSLDIVPLLEFLKLYKFLTSLFLLNLFLLSLICIADLIILKLTELLFFLLLFFSILLLLFLLFTLLLSSSFMSLFNSNLFKLTFEFSFKLVVVIFDLNVLTDKELLLYSLIIRLFDIFTFNFLLFFLNSLLDFLLIESLCFTLISLSLAFFIKLLEVKLFFCLELLK